MDIIEELGPEELRWWTLKIVEFRKKILKSPRDYVEKFIASGSVSEKSLRLDVSGSIEKIRQGCWDLYIKDEVKFHSEILKILIAERDIPKKILDFVIKKEINNKEKIITEEIAKVVGDYSGRIMPYIYALSLSTTNSRRSRSGKTFEAVIEYILDLYRYSYNNQSSLGTDFYKKHNVGKMVDCILPNKEAYEENRQKCMVVTMKTSLRERWQEVAEEIARTNTPHIYLLTVDKNLTEGVLTSVKQQNITIVTYNNIKVRFPSFKNIISFDTFFKEEIPHQMTYWKK